MKITFVGHASFLLESHGIVLLSDPWTKGLAFNDAWAVYPQPVLADGDLARVTHVWISHEHPDHLSIPTLQSIPPERRRDIVVLFQKHYSAEIRRFLQGLGFKEVLELSNLKWVSLTSEVRVVCRQVGHLDSALAIQDREHTVLNINDCDVPRGTMTSLKATLGRRIDVLLDQFSFAGWIGNPSDRERKDQRAAYVLEKFVRDFETADPKWVIPFASFVRFCRPENAHMNAHVNSVADIAERIPPDRLAVLYPGDQWDLRESWTGTGEAIRRFEEDLNQIEAQPLFAKESKSFEEVLHEASNRANELKRRFHLPLRRWVGPVLFYVDDLNRALQIDPVAGTAIEMPAIRHAEEAQISLHSQAAWYSFKFRWGMPTLGVSGIYSVHRDEWRFRRLKKLLSAYSTSLYTQSDRKSPWSLIPPPELMKFAFARMRSGDLYLQFIRRFTSA